MTGWVSSAASASRTVKHSDTQEKKYRDNRDEEQHAGEIDYSVDKVCEMSVKGEVMEQGGDPFDAYHAREGVDHIDEETDADRDDCGDDLALGKS